ncbi:ATP-binding cassette domain-containing protein [Rhodococcus hoagii]|nr:ATP-binding cassette domain-containing protein [Prescottella equi]
MGTRAVSIADGRKSFHGRRRPVLDGVNLDVESGEILAIVGSSGSGKSTCSGSSRGSTNSTPARSTGTECAATPVRATGVVFQKPLLMPWLTVRENVRLGGRFAANDAVFDPSYPTTSWTVSDSPSWPTRTRTSSRAVRRSVSR